MTRIHVLNKPDFIPLEFERFGVTSQVIGTTSFPDIRDHHFHDLILY